MGLPKEPLTLNPLEVEELNQKLSNLRHNINNHLSLIVAATEVMRRKPELAPRMVDSVSEQPDKIIKEIRKFTDEFESMLRITRD